MGHSDLQTFQFHRRNIDDVDEQIIELLSRRQQEVKSIGELKRKNGLPVLDAKRELSARTKRRQLAKKLGLDALRLEVLFEHIVLLAREEQQKERKSSFENHGKTLRVGVMGGIGSFSEGAAVEFLLKHHLSDYQLSYPISSENVLKDLENGRIDVGIFPIENSIGGLVTESIFAASHHTFDIEEIFEYEVIQCLMALSGVKKGNIRKIMSHEQALRQCRGYLAQHFPLAELIEATDTAEGARILEQSPEEKNLAVIAPKQCAELYHLKLLEERIQDQKINFTRFIAARRRV